METLVFACVVCIIPSMQVGNGPQAGAQSPQPPALAAVSADVLAQFDFLDGEWDFTYTVRNPDGSAPQVSKGKWTARKTANGRLIEDSFVFVDAAGQPQATGIYTYRVYNRVTSKWNYRSVNTGTGLWQEGTAAKVGNEMHLLQTSAKELTGAPILRIRYYDIRPDRFSWMADASLDGGHTWFNGVATIEATRAHTR